MYVLRQDSPIGGCQAACSTDVGYGSGTSCVTQLGEKPAVRGMALQEPSLFLQSQCGSIRLCQNAWWRQDGYWWGKGDSTWIRRIRLEKSFGVLGYPWVWDAVYVRGCMHFTSWEDIWKLWVTEELVFTKQREVFKMSLKLTQHKPVRRQWGGRSGWSRSREA